jgi:hydroxyquinol 1,2-dioxygenase
MSLRARFRTGSDGGLTFWSIMPSSYGIPGDGPVGEMLAAQGRHNFRPAHVHFRISAPGFHELVTHVFVEGDEYLESDAVFGVKGSLIADFEHLEPGVAPGGARIDEPWARLTYDFSLAPVGT